MRETVGDLDLLVTSAEPPAAIRAFTSMPSVKEVILAGDTKATVILAARIQADVRVLEPGSWGAGLVYFTGNKDHNIHLRTMAQERGWKLDAQQRPNALHVMITPAHARVAADFLRDLRECTAAVATSTKPVEGAAAMYGMLASIPDRTMVHSAILDFMDGLDTID